MSWLELPRRIRLNCLATGTCSRFKREGYQVSWWTHLSGNNYSSLQGLCIGHFLPQPGVMQRRERLSRETFGQGLEPLTVGGVYKNWAVEITQGGKPMTICLFHCRHPGLSLPLASWIAPHVLLASLLMKIGNTSESWCGATWDPWPNDQREMNAGA